MKHPSDKARALLEAALEEGDGRAVHQLLNAALDRAGVLEMAGSYAKT